MKNSKDKKPVVRPKGLLIKILVPVLIVVIVAGIYVFKNLPQENPEVSYSQSPQSETMPDVVASKGGASANTADIDFFSDKFDLDATDDFDLAELLSYGLPVIIDFGSDSCIPCQQMAPVLEELNEELRGKVIVKFVDVWENPDAAEGFPLRAIPTQFFFDSDGNPYVPGSSDSGFIMYEHRQTGDHLFTAHEGAMDKDAILAVLEEMGAV